MKRTFIVIIGLFLLTGCWSNQELNNTALVHGVGLDKSDDQLRVSFEIIKPGGGQEGGQEVTSVESGEHIVLEETTDTLLDGARELIKYTKRRLDFGHTEAWIISEKLARDGIIRPIDIIRRDQQLRLNSHMFVTKDNPTAILNTPTLYEHLVSSELASSLPQTKFIAEYAPITLREFYKLIEGPVSNAYIPIIYLDENNKQEITAIDGTAVIKKDRMVGELDKIETAGLNLLLNNVKGGSIQVNMDENEKVSLEISKLKTKTMPKLTEDKLGVTIQTKIKGTLGDNMTTDKIDEEFFKKVEKEISDHTKDAIRSTLNKLQTELKTDITNIGPETYRKYPKEWEHVRSNWNEIFANADITIDVDTNVTHQGLINENIHHHEKPYNNPYRISK